MFGRYTAGLAVLALLFASSLAAQASISVTAGGAALTNGQTVPIPFGTNVEDLDLEITVDSQGSATDLTITVSNFTTQGLDVSEWTSAAAAVPYNLNPETGSFNVADVPHVVQLTADDGHTAATFTLILVIGPDGSGNAAPAISLFSAGTFVDSGAALSIPFNTNVTDLNLSIEISDFESDDVSVDVSVTNFTTQGLDPTQWTSSAAPAPYTLTPTAGQFNVADVVHVLTLTADDGVNTTIAYYILLVGPDGMGDAAPFIGLFSGNTYIAGGSIVEVPFNTQVSSLNLRLVVADYETGNVSVTLNGVTNFTTQGLDPTEWESTAAATPYELMITSGRFNVGEIDHVVTLTANDGTNDTVLSFTVRVEKRRSSSSDDGCSTGGGQGLSWLLLAGLLASLGVAARLRRA